MKTRPFLLCILISIGMACSSQTGDPVIQCLEEFVATEPYSSDFAALEQALIMDGVLESANGQAYRKMIAQVMWQDDLTPLRPKSVQFEAIPEAHYCYSRAEGEPPPLLHKLLQAINKVRSAPTVSPNFLMGAFLNNFSEADWEEPLTPHLFYSYLSASLAVSKRKMIKLPPWSDEEPDITQVKERNVFTVHVNAEDQILVRGEAVELEDLREMTKLFISNPTQREDLAESPQKAIISLKNDRGTSYKVYLDTYNELKAAYWELWDAYCQAKFNRPYSDDLPIDIQKAVKTAIPFIISEAEPTSFGEE
ncbi:MAG: biopolymer transporter ExbD [Bacteroidota bacterium]